MCGIVGIIGTPFAAKESYLGLLMLQHRGQDSAGILSFDPKSHSFHLEKNLGHVKEAINEQQINNLVGDCAIAHTRYSTIGKVRREEVQPMSMTYPYGIGMVHNGNLLNAEELKDSLLRKNRRMIASRNDLEVMMNILAKELEKHSQEFSFCDVENAVKEILNTTKGGYSGLALIAGQGLLAFKDPHALRPLCWGKRKLTQEEIDINQRELEYSYCFASESKSLEFLGYEDIEELVPGQLIFITQDGKVHSKIISNEKPFPCMFEWIYFANADSTIWNKNVYQMRLKFGELLGESLKAKNLNIDIVVPVPDTSRPSAITIAEKLQKPYREILIKNRYAQRTFILNRQKEREKAVNLKMNVVKEEVKGKNILLIDDSVVRGTTSKRIISLLKDCGAESVVLASTCPPIIKPCFFGIDFPDEKDLIAAGKTEKEMADIVGADSIHFLSIDDLKKSFAQLNTCMACLNGKYPIDTSAAQKMIETRIKHEETSLPGIR